MEYPLSQKYNTPALLATAMGPNPFKLQEEMLLNHRLPAGSLVCDLGSGQGHTSIMLVKDYGFKVYAADLWSDPQENRSFFNKMGLAFEQITPVKADATAYHPGICPSGRTTSRVITSSGQTVAQRPHPIQRSALISAFSSTDTASTGQISIQAAQAEQSSLTFA